MPVSIVNADRLALPVGIGWAVVPAGLLAIFATYWDEAWHTDVGRDSAWAAPHLLLYGSVAVVGLGIASWGVRVLSLTRSLRATLASRSLLAAGLGALGSLVAAPIDTAWHEAYGRDAVLWSPPHMLVVFASTALVLGALSGLPQGARALRIVTGVMLLANAAAVVFEYEADVPQFSEAWYLPLLLVVGLAAVWVVARAVPGSGAVATVVVGYAAVRLGIAAALLLLGRSTPDLPIAVLGLAAYDLPLRRTSSRFVAAAVATSALAWLSSATDLASPAAGAVAVGALPVLAFGFVVLLVRFRAAMVAVPAVLMGAALLVPATADRAEAHDPGQGDPIVAVKLSADTSAAGSIELTVQASEGCDDLAPQAVVARRAGSTLRAPLIRSEACVFHGELIAPEPGRWFVYVEFTYQGAATEAWLPVEAGTAGTLEQTRTLYRPAAQGDSVSWVQLSSGALVYLLGIALLAVGARAIRLRPTHASVTP